MRSITLHEFANGIINSLAGLHANLLQQLLAQLPEIIPPMLKALILVETSTSG
jgi:hypothetical protein